MIYFTAVPSTLIFEGPLGSIPTLIQGNSKFPLLAVMRDPAQRIDTWKEGKERNIRALLCAICIFGS